MYTTEVTVHLDAPPARMYAALLDPAAVARWRVPDGMSAVVHELDPRVGGRFRVTLTYDRAHDDPEAAGRSGAATDTYAGHFARLVPDAEVVEVLSFESEDPAMAGVMRLTTSLTAVGNGTDVTVRHEGVPDAVSREDNETGTRMALRRLAELCGHETGRAPDAVG